MTYSLYIYIYSGRRLINFNSHKNIWNTLKNYVSIVKRYALYSDINQNSFERMELRNLKEYQESDL